MESDWILTDTESQGSAAETQKDLLWDSSLRKSETLVP